MRFPVTYVLPRGGRLENVTVASHDDVRELRTELELLRRTRRRAHGLRGARRARSYTPSDVRDLAGILMDARHPLVEEAIAHIDAEFKNARKEILMTVVNEEAENIVQEAVESGAIDVTDSSPVAPPPDAVDAGAPPEATSQTDDAPGEPQDAVSDPQDAESDTASADIDATNEETPECIEDPGDEGPISESADTDGQAKTAETAEPAEATDPTDSADGADADEAAEASIDETESLEEALDNASADLADVAALAAAGLEDEIEDLTTEDVALEMPTETVESEAAVESTAPVADDSADPMMEETSDACQAASPEAAARAVAEIETGIRRLGELLATQVHEQWGHARQALEEANSLKAKLEGSTDTAEAILLDVQRIKDEALIARDETVLASRKAKLAREDARRCQARAGKSADAAETAADLALQEVRNLSTIADG